MDGKERLQKKWKKVNALVRSCRETTNRAHAANHYVRDISSLIANVIDVLGKLRENIQRFNWEVTLQKALEITNYKNFNKEYFFQFSRVWIPLVLCLEMELSVTMNLMVVVFVIKEWESG